jgi:mannitol 2-dehydrogenase
MDELIGLSLASLDKLPPAVLRPTYARSTLKPGIVHIGLGNFHRAHQAWYTHRLMQMGLAQDWAIIGAGVRPNDAVMRDRLLAQDCLTTLITRDPAIRRAEVTGAMVDFLPVTQGHAALIARMAEPDIRIVSLTVTEGGYYIDAASGGLDLAHPDIMHDAANPQSPRTAFGAMVAALAQRKAAGLMPFTGLCCDNLQGNGQILRQTILGLAQLSDPALAEWIAANGRFPNSMVDCIVPATGPQEIALAREWGIDDKAPVTHEDFRQWVIEDDFTLGRPDWDKVGATFSAQVHDYEMMKIRILNGGHQVICGAGELLGLGTIAATMAQPAIAALFDRIARDEIAPFVDDVPGMRAQDYIALIAARFANPAIADTTRRVAFDGSSRHAGFILPSIRANRAAGIVPQGLALVSAIWARYCLGRTEAGDMIAPNDPHWPALQAAAIKAESDPRAWLDQHAIYGDLRDDADFADAFCRAYRHVQQSGVAAAIAGERRKAG